MSDDDKDKEPWGFPSYDVDKDDDEDPTIIYTRHEVSGRVNQYVDNNDGGHGHFSWETEDDYENCDDENDTKDYSREDSNDSDNPSQAEVEERSGCYLTSACIAHYKETFDDNCLELRVLREFRDNYISTEEKKHYYKVAPQIVIEIEKEKNSNDIFNKIYKGVVAPCVLDIIKGQYEQAYRRYKMTILAFEHKYGKNRAKNYKAQDENESI